MTGQRDQMSAYSPAVSVSESRGLVGQSHDGDHHDGRLVRRELPDALVPARKSLDEAGTPEQRQRESCERPWKRSFEVAAVSFEICVKVV